MKLFRRALSSVLAFVILFLTVSVSPVEVTAASKNILVVGEIEHGTVEIVSGGDNVPDNFTVRLRAFPEDGYEVGEWNVYYRSSGDTIPVERVGFSDDYTFTTPKTNRTTKYIIISAEFVKTDSVPHTVHLSYSDGSDKGSSVAIDREDGSYLPGETVTVTVKKSEGSAFATDGLEASYYIDANNNCVFLKDFADYTEVDDVTVSFSMPDADVFIVCVFDNRKATVTVEKYFGDEGKLASEMSDKELSERACYDPVTKIYDYDKKKWVTCGLPVELYTNDIMYFESPNNTYSVYENGLYVTGITAYYTIDGEEVTEDLVDYGDLGPARELKAKLVMPGVDVTIRYTVSKLYKVETDENVLGELTPNISLALPGDVVKLTPNPVETYELEEALVAFDNGDQTLPVGEDLTFVMPAFDVRINTRWRREYVSRHYTYDDVDGRVRDVFYSDDYFSHPSTEYDAHLATLSIFMTKFSMNVDGPGDENKAYWYEHQPDRVEGFFKTIGFGKFEANEDYKSRTRFDSIGVAVASREIDGYTVIAVVPRSGGYFLEWANNVWLGDGMKSDYMHEGWYNAANKLISFIKDYVAKNGITGKVKLWMAGYSRGGAVTNIAAGLLDNTLSEGVISLGNGATVRIDDLYAYTFEAPQGANVNSKTVYHPKNRLYDNIWNVINPNDLVTKVAMAQYGFTRFGRDRYITTEFFDSANYNSNRAVFKALYGMKNDASLYSADTLDMYGITGDHYAAAMAGIVGGGTYELVKAVFSGGFDVVSPDKTKVNYSADIVEVIFLEELTNVMGSRERYVKVYQSGMRDLLIGLMSDENAESENGLESMINCAIASGIGEAVGVAVPFGVVITELIDEAAYDPEDTFFMDNLVHAVKDVFSERPNELVTLAVNIGDIFDNHSTDVTVSHLEAQDYFYTTLYNDTHEGARLSTVPLRDNADMGRVTFTGFNDLKLESGGVTHVVVNGKYVGKSDVSKCDGGFAAGYYSFATMEKMELFFPVNTEVKLTSDSYSKKPYHDANYDIYCQYSSIGDAGTIKKYIDRYRGEFTYISDAVEQSFTVTP